MLYNLILPEYLMSIKIMRLTFPKKNRPLAELQPSSDRFSDLVNRDVFGCQFLFTLCSNLQFAIIL